MGMSRARSWIKFPWRDWEVAFPQAPYIEQPPMANSGIIANSIKVSNERPVPSARP